MCGRGGGRRGALRRGVGRLVAPRSLWGQRHGAWGPSGVQWMCVERVGCAAVRWWLVVRADVRQRWGSLLLLIVLAGVAGGIAMAAVAGARRTTTSWDRLRAADGASDLNVYADIWAGGARADVTPEDLARLRAIPGARVAGANIMPLSPGLMGLDRSGDAGLIYALDDESLTLAMSPRHLRGRVPDRPDEVVVNEAVADGLGLDVGDRFTLRTSTVRALDICITELSCVIEEPPPVDVVVSGISRQASDLDPDAFNRFLLFAGPRFAELLTESHPVLVFFGSVFLDADTRRRSTILE